MLGIMLMILKVIGWILLGLLGLLLFLICLVLFVPVPYRVWVNGAPEQDPVFECKVKIFGIQVFPRKRKSSGSTPDKEHAPAAADTGADAADMAGTTDTAAVTNTTDETKSVQETQTDSKKTSEKGEKESAGTVKRPEKKFSHSIFDTGRKIWTELTDKHNKRALAHVLREIKGLLHHIGPRHVYADVAFSLGDPANTGYATAVLSVCPFAYGKKCRIEPDFLTENLYLKGWVDLRGHVCLVHALASGLRLLFDRDIRRIIKKLRR